MTRLEVRPRLGSTALAHNLISDRRLVCWHDTAVLSVREIPFLSVKRRRRGPHGDCYDYWEEKDGHYCFAA